MSAPEISIIIRTFNESKFLPGLFDALDRQTNTNFETIVVDSGSFDATLRIAEARASKVVKIVQNDFTFGYSLNAGIEVAQGKYIAIVSAHTEPTDPSWLENLIAPLRNSKNAMCYGKQIGGESSKFGEFLDFGRIFGDVPLELKAPNFFANNANSAVRKDLWEKHRFDETLPGLEDIEWAKYFMQQGMHVIYEPTACLHHYHNETWPQVRRRYYREAQAAFWIMLVSRRDCPGEILREIKSLAGDLASAFNRSCLLAKAGEIFRFRYEKTIGTLIGIWAGKYSPNPMERRQLYFDTSYRAVVIDGPSDASLKHRSLPPLTPGQVLIKVSYQGVCATDIEILEGTLGYFASGESSYPIVPGHELSGTVADIGLKVDDLEEGTPVVVECIQGCGHCDACRRDNPIGCDTRKELGVMKIDGGYADYVIVPRKFVHALPRDIDLKKAALCEPLAVVLKGLRRFGSAFATRPKARYAIIGAGTIGHLTAKTLSLKGNDVTVFDHNADRLASLPQYKTETTLEKIDNFDVIVEATGNPDVLEAVLHDSGAGAAILLLGLPYDKREFSFESIVAYDKTIVGSVGSSSLDFKDAIQIISDIDTTPLTQSLFPLENYEAAWGSSRSGKALKCMLEVNPTPPKKAPLQAEKETQRI